MNHSADPPNPMVLSPGGCRAGSIPEELGALTKLEQLLLDKNRLTGKGVSANEIGVECGPCSTKSELGTFFIQKDRQECPGGDGFTLDGLFLGSLRIDADHFGSGTSLPFVGCRRGLRNALEPWVSSAVGGPAEKV